ncbi:DUF305 domain-containing protein [Spinactinospora alkalitolerans]|uniref:DUF305 domain-containing protein n=1 Tax=Spinactinospora alkalitolerans TaxID=687207 RepID=UPI0035E3F967
MVPVSYEGEGGTAPAREAPRRRRISIPVAALLVVAALVCGYLVGRPGHPLESSADAGFLRDMSAHHAQAVDMSLIIMEETEEPTLDTVAYDITRTQQAQIGRMQGWLALWGLSARGTRPPMAWMAGHGHGSGGEPPERMPGLATEEQMQELREAEGEEAEILFLRLMTEHHLGGVDMAEAAVGLADEPIVVNFAKGMVTAQQSEIDLMADMLEERGADPEGSY